MKTAGLFAGVGGIELGLEKAGHTTRFLCDIDAGAQAVLRQKFPGTDIESDISNLASLPRGIELLAAGFPCQNLSQAGRTEGIHGHKSGLVRHAFRLIKTSRPAWILLENVPFMLRLDHGRGIAYLVYNLERMGYQWAYRTVDTRAFGLPHRRERVYLLASRDADPARYLFAQNPQIRLDEANCKLAHGFYWTEGNRGLGWAVDCVPTLKGGSALGIPAPPAIWFSDGRFATPDIRDAERLQGLPANWTKPAETVSRPSYRWTLVGNAVSAPVSQWIGNRLNGSPDNVPDAAVEMRSDTAWPNAAFGGPKVGRFAVTIGSSPVCRRWHHLHEFLRFEVKPLSRRAAEGFSSRLLKSSLSRPPEFDRALLEYLKAVA